MIGCLLAAKEIHMVGGEKQDILVTRRIPFSNIINYIHVSCVMLLSVLMYARYEYFGRMMLDNPDIITRYGTPQRSCDIMFLRRSFLENLPVSVYTYMRHVCNMCATCEWRSNATDNCSVGSATTSLISLMPVLRVGEHAPR
jgi:hypothetical protein